MSRNVLFTSAMVSLATSMALFADPKIKPDPVGPPQIVQGAQVQVNPGAQPGQATPRVAVQIAPGQAGHQWSWKNPDHALASCVAIANQEEVAMGQLASQKAQNDDVKKFAQMLVSDHEEFLQKLKPFAPEASAAGFLSGEHREARTPATAPRTAKAANGVQQAAGTTNEPANIQVTAGTRPAANQAFRHLQIEREVAQQCLAQSTEKLNSETGEQFDKCFVGMQIGMHSAMKAKLTVYQRHASAELGQILAAGLKTTEQHLAKAEDLMKTLEKDSKTASSTETGNKKAATK